MSSKKNDDFLNFDLSSDTSLLDDDFNFEGSFSDILASLNVDSNTDYESISLNTDSNSTFIGASVPEFNVDYHDSAPENDKAVSSSIDADIEPEIENNSAPFMSQELPAQELADGLKDILPSVHESTVVTGTPKFKKSANGLDTSKDIAPANKSGKSNKSTQNKPGKSFSESRNSVKSNSKKRTCDSDAMTDENWAPYEQKLKKNKVSFTVAMVIYAVLFIAAAAFGVSYLYKYLGVYENTRPEHFMDSLMPTMSGDDWYALMREHCEIAASEFESQDDIYEAYYNAIVTSENSSYRKKAGAFTDENPVYTIRLGDADMLLLSLVPDESKSAGYGYNYWKIGDVDILANGKGLSSSSLVIDASANAEVYLNGILLSPRYIIDNKVPYQLSELENRFDSQPYKVKYQVDGLYLNYELRDSDGNELSAYKQEGNIYYYDIDRSERFGFTVTAMSDMTVTVNGTVLSAQEAAHTDAYPVLAGLEEYVSDIPSILTWSFSDLRTKPEITCVSSSGETLTPTVKDGTLVFDYPASSELEEKYGDRALGFINAYIKYATDDGNKTDTNYSKLVNYVLYKSDLHNFFYSSYLGGMNWGGVLSYTVNEVKVSDFVAHGDNCFSCIGYFNISQKTYYETRDYETTYVLVFVKSGNSWYAVRMDDSAT